MFLFEPPPTAITTGRLTLVHLLIDSKFDLKSIDMRIRGYSWIKNFEPPFTAVRNRAVENFLPAHFSFLHEDYAPAKRILKFNHYSGQKAFRVKKIQMAL